MDKRPADYIPALRFDWLTPFYDPLLKWGMRETAFKRRLMAQAGLRPGQRVLDLGCGTGTLTIMVKQAEPGAEVTGLDGDPAVLARARVKAAQAGVSIAWEEGLAYALPYPDQTFDRVLSSLMLHHLTRPDKRRALAEIHRVLRPGGELHIVDFGPPHGGLMRLLAVVVRRMEEAGDNIDGRIVPLLIEAGFAQVRETGAAATLVGPLSLYQAARAR